MSHLPAAVYVQTNAASGNEMLAFERLAGGGLAAPVAFATGGMGTGEPHLASQGSVVLDANSRRLLVTNAGSEAVAGSTGSDAKGIRDEAIARDGRHLYAIDADDGRIHGWAIGADGDLTAVAALDGLPATVAGLAAS